MGVEGFNESGEVCRRPKRRIGLGWRSAMRLPEASAFSRDQRVCRRFADACGIAGAVDRCQRCCLVGVEICDRRLEVRCVVAVIIPLSVRILIGGIDGPVDQRNKRRQSVGIRKIGNRDQHKATTSRGLMRNQRGGYDAAPIMADPDRRVAAEIVMQLHHVPHDLLVRVSVESGRC
ncbi:hypothetical protein D3C71_1425930 [compost metagenome]